MKFDGTYFSKLCDIVVKTIVEALESLTIEDINMYQLGYNKAIDDFVKFANTMPTVETEDGTNRPMWLEEMAERLKAGAGNGIDNQ